MMSIHAPIPELELPRGCPSLSCSNEPLVNISDVYPDLFVFAPKYYDAGFSGATTDFFLRKTACAKLIEAAKKLLAMGGVIVSKTPLNFPYEAHLQVYASKEDFDGRLKPSLSKSSGSVQRR